MIKDPYCSEYKIKIQYGVGKNGALLQTCSFPGFCTNCEHTVLIVRIYRLILSHPAETSHFYFDQSSKNQKEII